MSVETKEQVSAGGVVFRRREGGAIEVALISVGEKARWQLPKGLVGRDESPEDAALREVREEAGCVCELVAPIEVAEYWYFGTERGGGRVRFHKFVHFYLMRYVSGDVADHDAEVNEARWFEIGQACAALAFKSERQVAARARAMIGIDERGTTNDEATDRQDSFQF